MSTQSCTIQDLQRRSHALVVIRVFTHDLANFDNSFSQQQLDRVVDPACTGEPYFRDSEVKLLRFTTIVADGEKTLEEFIQEAQYERLSRRKKKKVESNYYRSPPNHKIAPVLEQALSIT